VTETSNVFLRWARLKREVKEAPSSEAASTGIEAAAPRAGPDAPKHEPFDAASLPSVDATATRHSRSWRLLHSGLSKREPCPI
jgi:hypothetical protein